MRNSTWHLWFRLSMMTIERWAKDKWAHFPKWRWLLSRTDLFALFTWLSLHTAAGSSEGFTPKLWTLIYCHRSLHYSGKTSEQIGELAAGGILTHSAAQAPVRCSSRWFWVPGFLFSLSKPTFVKCDGGRTVVFHHRLDSESLGVFLQAEILQTKINLVWMLLK